MNLLCFVLGVLVVIAGAHWGQLLDEWLERNGPRLLREKEKVRQINAEGLELVKSSEGLRLTKYRDVAGKWTIGYGHLIKPGEEFEGPITEERATELLEQDLRIAEAAVSELVYAGITKRAAAVVLSAGARLPGVASAARLETKRRREQPKRKRNEPERHTGNDS